MATARRRSAFWRALESIPDVAAVDAVWRVTFGPDYEAAARYRRPNGRLASSISCTVVRGCGCEHQIVIHADDDFVAVCRCDLGCRTFSVQRTDLVIYELNRLDFDKAIADVFELRDSDSRPTDLPRTTQIGVYSPLAGYRFPVYFTIIGEPDGFDAVADGLAARTGGPFVLLIPSCRFCRAETVQRLTRSKSALLILEDCVTVEDGGTLRPLEPLASSLAAFRAVNLPSPRVDGSPSAFPTPPDASWQDVRIRFMDGHTVAVSVMDVQEVLHYSQMGMSRRNSSKPTVQWDLLQRFAEGEGTLTWKDHGADRRNQKRRENLARDLSRFFRIEGDPIGLNTDRRGWHVNFRLQSDNAPASRRNFAECREKSSRNIDDDDEW